VGEGEGGREWGEGEENDRAGREGGIVRVCTLDIQEGIEDSPFMRIISR
jgi:hypothetical protein